MLNFQCLYSSTYGEILSHKYRIQINLTIKYMYISLKFFLILYMEIYENFIHLFSQSTLTALRIQRKRYFKHLPNTSLRDTLHRQIKKVLRDT